MTTQAAHPLAAARKAAGWTQTQLAVRADVSIPTVQRLEAGRRGSHTTWEALASALGVDVVSIQHGAPNGRSDTPADTRNNPPLAAR